MPSDEKLHFVLVLGAESKTAACLAQQMHHGTKIRGLDASLCPKYLKYKTSWFTSSIQIHIFIIILDICTCDAAQRHMKQVVQVDPTVLFL